MGSVYKPEGYRAWVIDYYDRNGKRVRKNSRTTDKKMAEGILAKIEAREFEIQQGLRKDVPERVEIRPLIEDFLAHIEMNDRASTIKRHRISFASLLDFLRVEYVEDITAEAVEHYMKARLQAGKASKTINNEVGSLKTMLNWALRTRRIAENPVALIKPLTIKRTCTRRALTTEEVERVCLASPPDFRLLWYTFATTGMRKNELVSLTWEDVNLEPGAGYFKVREENSKTRKSRVIPIPEDLRAALAERRKDALLKYVFTNRAGRPWRNNLLTRFKACVKKAGINPEGVDIHALRYTFVTHLLRAGVNIKSVQKLAGHVTVQVTLDIYAQVFPEDNVEAVSRLPYAETILQEARSGDGQGELEVARNYLN